MKYEIIFAACLVLGGGLAAWWILDDRKARKRPPEVQEAELREVFLKKEWGPKDAPKTIQVDRCGLPLQRVTEIAAECGYRYTGEKYIARGTRGWEFRPSR